MSAAPVLDLFINLEPETEGAQSERLEVATPPSSDGAEVLLVPRSKIHPDPNQPRRDADADLRANLALRGQLQAVGIRTIPPMEGVCEECGVAWSELAEAGDYLLTFGERRWRSSEGVLVDLKATLREDAARLERLLVQLAENAHRPMNPLDEARAFLEIKQERPLWSHARIAAETGRKRQTVSDRLALFKNAAWVPLLENGEITISQMVELSRFSDQPDAWQEQLRDAMRAHLGADNLADVEIADFRAALRMFTAVPDSARAGLDDERSIAEIEQAAGDEAAATASPDSLQHEVTRPIDEILSKESLEFVRDGETVDSQPLTECGDAWLKRAIDALEREFASLEDVDERNVIALELRVLRFEAKRRFLEILEEDRSGTDARANHDDEGKASASGTAPATAPASLETSPSQDEAPSEITGAEADASSLELPVAPSSDEYRCEECKHRVRAGRADDHAEDCSVAASTSERGVVADAERPNAAEPTDGGARGGQLEEPEREALSRATSAARSTSDAPPRASAGLLEILSELVASKPLMITLGPSGKGPLRVNIIPPPGGSPKFSAAITVDGHAAQLDALVFAAVSKQLGRTNVVQRTSTTKAATESAPSPSKRAAPAAKKTPVRTQAKRKAAPAKPKAGKSRKRKPDARFMAPMQPSAALAAVIGTSNPLPRTEVTKKLWAYIKRNGLQDAKERRVIKADDKMRVIFKGKSSASMFELTKLVNAQLSPIGKSAATKAKKTKAGPARAIAKNAKPARPKKLELRPDATLAPIIGAGVVRLPAAVKGVQRYIKEHDLLGSGATRGFFNCDDQLRALFGAPVVKLNQLPKLLKPHLVTRAPAVATQTDPAERATSADSETPPPPPTI